MGALLPPATIGIIGGGQLGMMIVREAQRMGYRTCVLEPDPECPAKRLADTTITAAYDDPAALEHFAALCDVITYEFENIDAAPVAELELLRPLYPGSGILTIAQNRMREKFELQQRGFPVVEYEVAPSPAAVEESLRNIGYPAVVKTTTAGYDGKGQAVIRSKADATAFLESIRDTNREYVVERFTTLRCELSVIAARGLNGNTVIFPVCENEHRNNILHITRVPARVSVELRRKAADLGTRIMESFNVVGVLCIEMFVTEGGDLIVNELAPRPHNSGHYTLDACDMSQFEALIRAACGLPLTEPRLLSPCAMVNILGSDMERLDIPSLLREEGVKVHLYGKSRIEPRRKMGHVTIMKESNEEVEGALQKMGFTNNK